MYRLRRNKPTHVAAMEGVVALSCFGRCRHEHNISLKLEEGKLPESKEVDSELNVLNHKGGGSGS